jgi:hypothetical protein
VIVDAAAGHTAIDNAERDKGRDTQTDLSAHDSKEDRRYERAAEKNIRRLAPA